MVEDQSERYRFSYFRDAIFEPTKMKLILGRNPLYSCENQAS